MQNYRNELFSISKIMQTSCTANPNNPQRHQITARGQKQSALMQRDLKNAKLPKFTANKRLHKAAATAFVPTHQASHPKSPNRTRHRGQRSSPSHQQITVELQELRLSICPERRGSKSNTSSSFRPPPLLRPPYLTGGGSTGFTDSKRNQPHIRDYVPKQPRLLSWTRNGISLQQVEFNDS